MISKVAKKRRDGRSSFKALKKYIADRLRVENFVNNSSPYLQKDGSTKQLLGSGVTVEYNALDYSTINAEFESVIAQRPDIEDPIYHFIISWSEQDDPSDDIVLESAKEAIKVLGFSGHQYLSAIHKDTDNIHVHVAVNKIHPDTLKVLSPSNDYYKLGDLMGRIENKYGFKKTRQKTNNGSNKARMDADCHGDLSGKRWISEEIKKEMKSLLKSSNSVGWEDVHNMLLNNGVTYNKSGSGAVFVIANNESEIKIKASSIDRSFSLSSLEKRLGKYRENVFKNTQDKNLGDFDRYINERNRHERNNVEKEVRRCLERRYNEYWESCLKDFHDIKSEHERAVRKILKESRDEISDLYKKYDKGFSRDALIEALRWERDRKIYGMKLKLIKKISNLRNSNMLSWKDWVIEQAKADDPEASTMLHSWNYNRHKIREGGNYIENCSSEKLAEVPLGYEILLNWKREKRKDGVVIFYDSKNKKRISHQKNGLKVESHDNSTIDSAVFMAAKMYKHKIRITGDKDFKEDVLKAVLRYEKFTQEKITIENSEMNKMLEELRKEQQRSLPSSNDRRSRGPRS